MMSLDIYLSTLTNKEYYKIKHQIIPSNPKKTPLLSWDIYSQHHFKTLKNLKKERDINIVKLFSEKEKWHNDIDSIFENQEFEAIIVTDLKQKILWVNSGFTEMTGYSKKFALNKTPRFLQGENTSSLTKQSIRHKLKHSHPFTQIITNYKKDKSPYKCEVKIIPLYNNNTVTHYLAIERRVI